MSENYKVVGTSAYKQLLADPQGADVIAVPVASGAGDIEIGTLLFRDASGSYKPAAAADVTSTKSLVVAKETIESGDDAGSVVDAGAYRAGSFVDGAVKLKDGTAVTAEQKVTLRLQNIVFDVMD
ncbi:MAG: hypothetical protein Q4B09_05330 [Lachnospiraceae bacterium]|nr:hypothetical protein [Lachnospiraceae bacterium]